MIIFDTPRSCSGPDAFRSFRMTAHCMSTLLGEEGTQELLTFGKRIGLQESWIQNRGTYREHFDLFDSKIEKARKAGAVQVTARELYETAMKPKKPPEVPLDERRGEGL